MLASKADIALPGLVQAPEFTGRPQEAAICKEAQTWWKEHCQRSRTYLKPSSVVRWGISYHTNLRAEVLYLIFFPQLVSYSYHVPGFELSPCLAEK